ncbi:UNKNOWN [Stylonychia lemnae]|uniref:Uncharacterized protein n=1 Tax=Stylonychia lemnae TaxID=5949 RepID=A0A078AR26_STYLE|nr:UNKNOWN [Stylonychia lemnae]|eukprot:CDW83328.1 UNKNOWN [Stylonychia lemnae]
MERYHRELTDENPEYQLILQDSIESDPNDFNQTQTQVWRNELKVGDIVDVNLELPKSQGDLVWVQAKIMQIQFEVYLKLDFIFDKWQQKQTINKWSVKIQQFGIHTQDSYKQRDNLKTMMFIDSYKFNNWNRAIILDIKEMKLQKHDYCIKMAFIGWRIYCELEGNNEDEIGSFIGWSKSFDDWVPLYSQSIRPFLTQLQHLFSEIKSTIDISKNEITNQEYQRI